MKDEKEWMDILHRAAVVFLVGFLLQIFFLFNNLLILAMGGAFMTYKLTKQLFLQSKASYLAQRDKKKHDIAEQIFGLNGTKSTDTSGQRPAVHTVQKNRLPKASPQRRPVTDEEHGGGIAPEEDGEQTLLALVNHNVMSNDTTFISNNEKPFPHLDLTKEAGEAGQEKYIFSLDGKQKSVISDEIYSESGSCMAWKRIGSYQGKPIYEFLLQAGRVFQYKKVYDKRDIFDVDNGIVLYKLLYTETHPEQFLQFQS